MPNPREVQTPLDIRLETLDIRLETLNSILGFPGNLTQAYVELHPIDQSYIYSHYFKHETGLGSLFRLHTRISPSSIEVAG